MTAVLLPPPEFVTNEDTNRMIRRLGVDYAQGYHISQPLALDDILATQQRDHRQDFPAPGALSPAEGW